ncbi:MAG: cobalamin-binding protein [Phycisphaerae bacterium]|nr:cobalamin-binding protein [Phycisphaerae bacterium]MDD5380905.1 cobalamin-binding protein [Phycisphaerae bacterium]
MKKRLAILAVSFVFLMLNTQFLVLEQVSGNEHRSPSIQRIVSLSPNLTEIVFSLGLGDRVVGVSSDSDWPAEANSKPKVGTFWQPNIEVIIAAKPDLVICETFLQQNEAAQALKRVGLNVLALRIESIDELFSAIRSIGQDAGCPEKAEQLADSLKKQLDQIREESSSLQKVKVLWVIQTEPVRVAGVNTFVNEIIELAGGRNTIAPTGDQYPSISTEELIGCNAEVIIQSAMGTEDLAKQQKSAEKSWNRFANLPAVKNKRIYVINPDTVLRLGPRVGDGVQTVAQCLRQKGNQ